MELENGYFLLKTFYPLFLIEYSKFQHVTIVLTGQKLQFKLQLGELPECLHVTGNFAKKPFAAKKNRRKDFLPLIHLAVNTFSREDTAERIICRVTFCCWKFCHRTFRVKERTELRNFAVRFFAVRTLSHR